MVGWWWCNEISSLYHHLVLSLLVLPSGFIFVPQISSFINSSSVLWWLAVGVLGTHEICWFVGVSKVWEFVRCGLTSPEVWASVLLTELPCGGLRISRWWVVAESSLWTTSDFWLLSDMLISADFLVVVSLPPCRGSWRLLLFCVVFYFCCWCCVLFCS